ncbi:hypothetical protein GUITHDRAFT_110466 [Guillardia theta CCMP2712]|uniref:ATPase of the ABC class N-terminal domain-containing protein n=1 Tax=Guillardia theta (strain CCMP2712) TaxID=905079 RepID=L1J557_GUITC|nr:hypothetical protein GUITHDRAFT_110466 [Guillardia theta CCMP2712]EKX43668.1 hypothetical protein GUITHDRAFT_110466 [Guillardia theta CCMP2712]|eukprot:XP_005830648.1 hypothetical protein GUITHDRAFT_110466 [Guillardia theta CCMP2712]
MYGGGRSREHGEEAGRDDRERNDYMQAEPSGGRSSRDLDALLRRLDGAGYKAYHDLKGSWSFDDVFTLTFDHIQSDSYAPPSRCHVRVAQSAAKFPAGLFDKEARRIGLCDFLARSFCAVVSEQGLNQAAASQGWSGPKGGDLQMECPGQKVLERTNVLISPDFVEARFTVALPAAGRSILGGKARSILIEALPRVIQRTLVYNAHDPAKVKQHVDCVEDTETLRGKLQEAGLV